MRLLAELTRFGGAAAINTLFGYGAYALFVWLGLAPLVAQAAAQVAGTLFNMRTYAIAFRQPTARGRFILAYAGNYLIGLVLLAILTRLMTNAYLAGLLALLAAAAINFAVLRGFVFRRAAAPV